MWNEFLGRVYSPWRTEGEVACTAKSEKVEEEENFEDVEWFAVKSFESN